MIPYLLAIAGGYLIGSATDKKLFAKGGSTLLAPNGKPSNLTPEQWHLVRTPEFKAWFGDWENDPKNASKVVDENGEPLVLWHNSNKKFNIFDSDKTKDGKFHFGTIGQAIDRLIYYIEEDGFDLSKFTSADTEKIAEYDAYWITVYYLLLSYYYSKEELHSYFYEYLENLDYSSYSIMNKLDTEERLGYIESLKLNLDKELIKQELDKYNIKSYFLNIRELQEVGDLIEQWNELNFTINNGYFYLNQYEGNKREYSYVLNNPKNIKLADGTNTTFDAENPDIRYSDGGEISKKIDEELKMKGFQFNKYNYRYGKEINEKDYITAFYDKTKMLYKIRGVHKFKTPLGENSVGIQFDFSNEDEFWNKINSYLLPDKYDKGGLVAPNGKPSNLTPKQYKLVRTPKFKAWFGDWENDPKNASKVVDINGEPLVVYHGTDNIFFEFDKKEQKESFLGRGFYLTKYLEYAETHGKFIIPCFVNILKPLVLGKFGHLINNGNIEEGVIYSDRIVVCREPNQIKLADGTNTTFDAENPDIRYKKGGETDGIDRETYQKWKSLVNMSKSELKRFYDSDEGKEAGLSSGEAKSLGIDSGRESARWIMKMKDTPVSEWSPTMWKWAKKQISFISRMRGNKGKLYDENGKKTRKHTSLLIWGHNPEK
jgi:hypothetical protein